jgi:RNA polymerase sigma-70 factor (ECF subfamily)
MVLTSSEILLSRLRNGDENAMREIFNTYYQAVFYSINRMLSNFAASEDLTQEVFLDIWLKREKLIITSSFQSYLQKMAINKTLNYLRSQKNQIFDKDISTLEDQYAEVVFQDNEIHELEEIMHQTIDNLPPQCKLIFVLSRFEDYSNKMIAEELNISIKTVENQMTKAIKILRLAIIKFKN